MSFALVYNRGQVGLQAPLVAVETHLANGLPQFTIVGLPETAVKESKDRVRSAIMQSGYEFPRQRITVNLAPADLPKEGGRFDLSIALSILLASKQLECPNILEYEFAAELALNGQLRPVKGILPFALASQAAKRQLITAPENVEQAALVEPLTLFGLRDLAMVCAQLTGLVKQTPFQRGPLPFSNHNKGCFSEVCGQAAAKRALEIAAAGGHSILMSGPPGTGKTMLASRLNSILPPLALSEMLEVAAIYSLTQTHFAVTAQRPFRNPHHTASAIALIGGGRHPLPGEISLAHHGVLFLDEFPEFSRHVIEVLRPPLESGKIFLSRANGKAEYPANCQLVVAMNPCPCGYLGTHKACRCSSEQLNRYRHKISGPLRDRIDIHLQVPALSPQELADFAPLNEESSATIQARVIRARAKQQQRQALNARLTTTQIVEFCALTPALKDFLNHALVKLGISARAFHSILKLARTIADLQDVDNLDKTHIAQAIQYRHFDRE